MENHVALAAEQSREGLSSTAAPTPGPWTYRRSGKPIDGEYDFAIIADGYVIAEAFGRVAHGVDGIRPAEANARLLAAARDMRDVCGSFSVIERDGRVVLRINGTEIVAVAGDTTKGMVLRQFGQNRREAIAKTEGRS